MCCERLSAVDVGPGDVLRFEIRAPEGVEIDSWLQDEQGHWRPLFEVQIAPGAEAAEVVLEREALPSAGRMFFGSLAALAAARSGDEGAMLEQLKVIAVRH
jgi:hypothetical protein